MYAALGYFGFFPVLVVSLQDIQMRKAFKSAVHFDQQVVSRDTMPTAMQDMYKQCDRPPALDKLNPYRYLHICILDVNTVVTHLGLIHFLLKVKYSSL